MNAIEARAFGLVDEILGDTEGIVTLQSPSVGFLLQGANGKD